VEVLCNMLAVFLAEADRDDWRAEKPAQSGPGKHRNFSFLLPVVKEGYRSAATIEHSGLVDQLWERTNDTVAQMIAPICSGPVQHFAQAERLAEILDETAKHVPHARHNELCTILATGAYKAQEIAISQADYSRQVEGREKRTSLKRRGGALRVFEACMSGLALLQPQSEILLSITRQVFQDALAFDKNRSGSTNNVSFDIAILACKAIKASSSAEGLVVAVFAQLCLLISSGNSDLRTEAGGLLERVNIAKALSEATTCRDEAERRASEAEKENELLKIALAELRDENRKLQRDIAVFSASSALT